MVGSTCRFVGLTYLAHRAVTGYPAADIAEKGVPLSLNPTPHQAASLVVSCMMLAGCCN